jgi:hypothetical protein
MKDTNMERQNLSPTSAWQRISTLAIAGLLLLSAVLACKSSSANSCIGEVSYQGRTFTGKGKNAEEAQHNGCNLYCLEADPDVDARYGIWLDSPKGKAAGSPAKKDSIYKDPTLLDYVTVTCANKCMAKIKDGSMQGQTKCP